MCHDDDNKGDYADGDADEDNAGDMTCDNKVKFSHAAGFVK